MEEATEAIKLLMFEYLVEIRATTECRYGTAY